MSPRTGRPKAENPKNNVIRVRLDDNVTEQLDNYCTKHETTRAEALRRGIDMLLNETNNPTTR